MKLYFIFCIQKAEDVKIQVGMSIIYMDSLLEP